MGISYVALRQMKFGTFKAYGHTYQFYLNRYFIWRKLLNIAVVQNIEVMLGQTENHFV
jgi:hypothetical protein